MFVYNPPQYRALCVAYMDDDLLVLSKPSGLLSVPGKGPDLQDSLEIRAKAAFPQALLTHRLDRGTSGIMVMAMNRRAQGLIGKHFERRLIRKSYIARVWGHVEGESGEIDEPLICDWPNRPKQKICYENGKPAQTSWRVIGRDEISTRIELKPHTGRSHQLRVHMLHLGHPILGDELYAPEEAVKAAPRLQLHAHTLTLHHPNDGTLVTFTDPCEF